MAGLCLRLLTIVYPEKVSFDPRLVLDAIGRRFKAFVYPFGVTILDRRAVAFGLCIADALEFNASGIPVTRETPGLTGAYFALHRCHPDIIVDKGFNP